MSTRKRMVSNGGGEGGRGGRGAGGGERRRGRGGRERGEEGGVVLSCLHVVVGRNIEKGTTYSYQTFISCT